MNSQFENEIRSFYHEASQHGSYITPDIADYIYTLVPIFGRAKGRHYFKDIRLVDQLFLEKDWNSFLLNCEKWNIQYNWKLKEDKIYWVGRISGGKYASDTLPKLHRMRWVKMANDPNLTLSKKSFSRFVGYYFCRYGACDIATKNYTGVNDFIDIQPFEQHWKYKVLLDLEGFSWSNRFKNLLYL